MKRNPDILAWEHWLLGEEARRCLEGKTEGQYLKNRLWFAFMAGRNSINKNAVLGISNEGKEV